ncbi:MAG: LamG domain-containing protein, partial [Sedimentisphaerales bacterium]|nr:LamG domain-containing protein [Sedimentisphaerales bacterium]
IACTGVTSSSIWGHIAGGTSVKDDAWHHVAGVYDGSGLYLYIDGVLDAQDEATGVINTNSYEVYVGENAETTGRYWNGMIDDARVYNRGLSHGEIVDLAGLSEIYQPVISSANISDEEPKHSRTVNFRDYALLAENWLRELLFPI